MIALLPVIACLQLASSRFTRLTLVIYSAALELEALTDAFGLPAHPGKPGRGAPKHDNTWLRGLYLVLDD